MAIDTIEVPREYCEELRYELFLIPQKLRRLMRKTGMEEELDNVVYPLERLAERLPDLDEEEPATARSRGLAFAESNDLDL